MVWFSLLPFVLLMEGVAILLAPILPLFSWGGMLPTWLGWFQTPDNNLMGDEGHYARWRGRSPYLQMVAWLLRNRAYGFKWGVCGTAAKSYRCYGTPGIGNRHSYKPGKMFLFDNEGFWYYKCVAPITSTRCWQVAFGWQLNAPIKGRCLYMFSPRITRYYLEP